MKGKASLANNLATGPTREKKRRREKKEPTR